MTTTSHWRYWLALIQSLNPSTAIILLQYFKDPEIILNTPTLDLAQASNLPVHAVTIKPDWRSIDQQLTQLISQNIQCITWQDVRYPKLLRSIHNPPLILFVTGNIQLLGEQQIAIVGARGASAEGITITEAFAYSLSEAKLIITSGLARGIDKSAHEGTLKAKAKTIAVLGSSLDIIYPSEHKSLARTIVRQGGTLVSEYPPGTPPHASHFPARNRILSGLTLGTLVIEAALRSGSLITARHALEQNREVFAVPGSVLNPLKKGCHHLIQCGAKLTATTQDVLEELRL